MCCHKAGGILTWIYGRGSRMAPYELCCIAHHQKAGGERERERTKFKEFLHYNKSCYAHDILSFIYM